MGNDFQKVVNSQIPQQRNLAPIYCSPTKYAAVFLMVLLCACSAPQERQIGEAAAVRLSPHSQGFWQADFFWDKPATQLHFVRSSNRRRAEQLRVLDQDFEIIAADEGDAIRRRDGTAFNKVSILESTSIEVPPAGYLPFVRFSDGGLLLHTGRFHACAGTCPTDEDQDEGPWEITLDPGQGSRMILNGRVETKPTRFTDTRDGTKIYIGDSSIIDVSCRVRFQESCHKPIMTAGCDSEIWPQWQRNRSRATGRVPGTRPVGLAAGLGFAEVGADFFGGGVGGGVEGQDFVYLKVWDGRG